MVDKSASDSNNQFSRLTSSLGNFQAVQGALGNFSAVQGANANLFGRVPSSANMSTDAFTRAASLMNSGDRTHQSASHNQRSRQEAYIDHALHPITFDDLRSLVKIRE